jgi:hypothetical protein
MSKRSHPKNIVLNANGTMDVFACGISHFNLNTNILSCEKKIFLNSHNPEDDMYCFVITFTDSTQYSIECWDSAELDIIAQEFLSHEFKVVP